MWSLTAFAVGRSERRRDCERSQSPIGVTPRPYRSGVATKRTVDPDDLVGAAEIAQRLGTHKQTVHLWRRRNLGFPAPIAELERALIFDWTEVEAWARETGRLR